MTANSFIKSASHTQGKTLLHKKKQLFYDLRNRLQCNSCTVRNEIGFTLFTAHEESCATAATGKLLALSVETRPERTAEQARDALASAVDQLAARTNPKRLADDAKQCCWLRRRHRLARRSLGESWLLWACWSSGASGADMAATTSRVSVPPLCYKRRPRQPGGSKHSLARCSRCRQNGRRNEFDQDSNRGTLAGIGRRGYRSRTRHLRRGRDPRLSAIR